MKADARLHALSTWPGQSGSRINYGQDQHQRHAPLHGLKDPLHHQERSHYMQEVSGHSARRSGAMWEKACPYKNWHFWEDGKAAWSWHTLKKRGKRNQWVCQRLQWFWHRWTSRRRTQLAKTKQESIPKTGGLWEAWRWHSRNPKIRGWSPKEEVGRHLVTKATWSLPVKEWSTACGRLFALNSTEFYFLSGNQVDKLKCTNCQSYLQGATLSERRMKAPLWKMHGNGTSKCQLEPSEMKVPDFTNRFKKSDLVGRAGSKLTWNCRETNFSLRMTMQ